MDLSSQEVISMKSQRKYKKWLKLQDQLTEELDAHIDNYFKERPFLDHGGEVRFENIDRETKQNEKNILSLCEELEELDQDQDIIQAENKQMLL